MKRDRTKICEIISDMLDAPKEGEMKDFIECLEDAAELEYDKMLQPDGRLRCSCGLFFDPDSEGGPISSNPYAMPVCSVCFEKWYRRPIVFRKFT